VFKKNTTCHKFKVLALFMSICKLSSALNNVLKLKTYKGAVPNN